MISPEQIAWLRKNPSGSIAYDRDSHHVLRGSAGHRWQDILLRHEDGEQVDWDEDTLVGIALYRFDTMHTTNEEEG